VLGSLAIALFMPSAASAAEKGTVPDLGWGTTRSQVDQTVALMQEAGVRWIRTNISWNAFEPNSKGSYNSGYISDVDYAVSKARGAGINVLMPVSDGVPYWASGDPNKYIDANGGKHWNVRYRPANWQDYADFFRWAVNHYKPFGVDHYEVWNEPNYAAFWPSGVNAAEYTQMLKAAYPAIKSVDPNAKVLFGGLSSNDYVFVEQAYAAGAKGYFDVMALHPYTCNASPESIWYENGRISKDAYPGYREVRASMVARGDAKPIWFTEFGWSTNPNVCPATEAKQADWIVRAYRYVEQDPYVEVSLQYNFRDTYFPTDDWNGNLGMLRKDFTKKLSFYAYRDYQPGTTNSAPTVRLTAPAAGSSFTSSLPVSADASDDQSVTKVEFRVKGRLANTDYSAPYSYTWYPRKKDRYGDYTVEARAYDASGQSAVDSVTVTRVRATSTSLQLSSKAVVSTRASADALVVRGRVRGPRRGRVAIELERLDAGGEWTRVAKPKRKLNRRGRFVAHLGGSLAPGRWRASASYAGNGRYGPSRSGYRYFTAG
jgi:hypothetical protein